MSRLASRIAALEAKRKADIGPRVVMVLNVPLSDLTEEEFEAALIIQQTALLEKCAMFDEELGLNDEADETPKLPGHGDAQAPLKDGQKRAKYLFTTDEKGRNWQLEIATGVRTLV